MQRFTDIRAWQRSQAMALKLQELTARLPAEQRFGLTSQIRRAATSVPMNIAEGSKRDSALEYARFLNTAEGSLVETEYLLVLSRDLGLISGQEIEGILEEVNEIERMLSALRRTVMRNH